MVKKFQRGAFAILLLFKLRIMLLEIERYNAQTLPGDSMWVFVFLIVFDSGVPRPSNFSHSG